MTFRIGPGWIRFGLLAASLGFSGCARHNMVLELRGTVIYEKPQIREISHTLKDSRLEGGGILVTVLVLGDPGLSASFDITPGIADRQAMKEIEEGRYIGESLLPREASGGPYTVTARLRHEKAGEVTRRDAETFTIPLLDR